MVGSTSGMKQQRRLGVDYCSLLQTPSVLIIGQEIFVLVCKVSQVIPTFLFPGLFILKYMDKVIFICHRRPWMMSRNCFVLLGCFSLVIRIRRVVALRSCVSSPLTPMSIIRLIQNSSLWSAQSRSRNNAFFDRRDLVITLITN
jgi:hypothetical protein